MTTQTDNNASTGDGAEVHAHFSSVLRLLGASLVAAAASSFMFRDWGMRDDVSRYLMLLGQLAMLAAAGLFCGFMVRERKGARTFLGLVVAVIPVHFAVLGGVLYSQFALDSPLSSLPAYAVWDGGSVATAIKLVLGAQLVLIPATWIAMRALVRQHATGLTMALIAFNAVLLVPLRGADSMALLLAAVVPLLLHLQLRVFTGTASLATPYGMFVRASLVVPVVILVTRTLMHYPLTGMFVGSGLLALGLALFASGSIRHAGAEDPIVHPLQHLGALLGLAGWITVSGDYLSSHVASFGGASLDTLVVALPCATLLWLASRTVARGAAHYQRAAAAIAGIGTTLTALDEDALVTSLICLSVGVVLAALGAAAQRGAVVATGAATALVGLVSAASLTIRIEDLTHWGTLTVVGTALIFLASAVDRNREVLAQRLLGARGHLRQWRV